MYLTEAHRIGGVALTFPNVAVHSVVRQAIAAHKRVNRHHPEFHASPDDMTLIDVGEMVADWAAIAQEITNDVYCSPRGYFEGTAKAKHGFSSTTSQRIESLIGALERVLVDERRLESLVTDTSK